MARQLLLETVQFPSVWKWLVPTMPITLRADFAEAVRTTTHLGPGWSFPLEIDIKGDPAFYANVTVVEPVGALEATAGVVRIVGFAPHKPGNSVVLEFVGVCAPASNGAGLDPRRTRTIRADYSVE